jgi:cell division protease FtsH
VRKISIIGRGMAAGYTLKVPKEEKMLRNRKEFEGEIQILLGGYTAEKIVFGETTTGSSDDLNKATNIARSIIKKYGMSGMGPIIFGKRESEIYLESEVESRNYSEATAIKIDEEVSKIILEAQKETNEILSKNRKVLDKIAKRLIEKETIEREEFEKIIG